MSGQEKSIDYSIMKAIVMPQESYKSLKFVYTYFKEG